MHDFCFYCSSMLNKQYTAFGYEKIGVYKEQPLLVPVCLSCQKKHDVTFHDIPENEEVKTLWNVFRNIVEGRNI